MKCKCLKSSLHLLWLLMVTGISCRQIDVYEKHTVIPRQSWESKFTAAGNFNIADTVSSYYLFIVLRHTDAYNFNNIWLNVGLQAPGDTMYTQKVNLSLGSDANGWEGTGMSDIWEVRKKLNEEPRRFKQAGVYQYRITHAMRTDPLLHLMNIGLRLEKVKPQ